MPCVAMAHSTKYGKSENIIQFIRTPTGTRAGNTSSVMWQTLLVKFITAVFHSRASTRKWSRTSKVIAIFGFLKLARKSLAQRRSWTYWSSDLAQSLRFSRVYPNEYISVPHDVAQERQSPCLYVTDYRLCSSVQTRHSHVNSLCNSRIYRCSPRYAQNTNAKGSQASLPLVQLYGGLLSWWV